MRPVSPWSFAMTRVTGIETTIRTARAYAERSIIKIMKRGRFYRQSIVFQTNAKKFYREIGKGQIDLDEPPAGSEIIEFWNSIWEKEMHFNNAAEWIYREKERMDQIDEQHWEKIESAELSAALVKSQKLKSPGVRRSST